MSSKYAPGPPTIVRRKAQHTANPEDLMIGELRTHYKRLCRVGHADLWRRLFSGTAALLAGGVVGAILAGPGWTTEVKGAATLAIFSGIAWLAIQDTDAESIGGIREDYKRDILDSFEMVEE